MHEQKNRINLKIRVIAASASVPALPLNAEKFMKRKICVSAFLILMAVCLFSGAMLLRDSRRKIREREANRLLAEKVRQAGEQKEEELQTKPSDKKENGESLAQEEIFILPEYRELWEQNQDLSGWLTIEDLGIDYPVMSTPDDPEYYLRRGFDKKEAVSGSLFTGEGCFAGGGNTIIYGHHMKDGTMFGNLDRYSQESYAREHSVIRFDTLTEKGEYQVIGAFYSRIYSLKEKDAFRYYWYIDLRKKESFEEYTDRVKASSLYDLGVDAAFGDELLTLSTCSYHEKEGRFVVVAKKTG